MSRWFESLNKRRRTLEDAVVDLSIALEAVFVPADERADRAKALRERVSAFWYETDPNPTKTNVRSFKQQITDAYDVRSRIAHGAIVSRERLEETKSFLDQVVRELLGDFIAGHLETFDPLAYWKPLTNERCLDRVCVGVHCRIPDLRS